MKKLLIIIVLAALVVGGAWLIIRGRQQAEQEVLTVARRDLVESVTVSGRVEAQTVADLGFKVSGTVDKVWVKNNAQVVAGQRLVTLSLGTLPAELESAKADLAIKQAESANTEVNLETIKNQHDTLVASALAELLSNDLIAEPTSISQIQTPPTITGRYTGPEGEYKLRVTRPSISSNKYELRTFGIEKTVIDVNKTGPTKLGSHGLFISFPGGVSEYNETTWRMAIPNIKSATYSSVYNNYQQALRDRDRAVEEAQAELRQQQSIGESIYQAELRRATAEIERIEAEMREHILVAPFAGIVTAIAVDPGEAVTANSPALTLLSRGNFQIVANLPELDSVKVQTGDEVKVKIDALDQEEFLGTVNLIDRGETIVDGVPVYETRITLASKDPRITSGLTAEVTILTARRQQVLVLPQRALVSKGSNSWVVYRVSNEGEQQEIFVTRGLSSTDGWVEIVSGLTDGDQVIVPTGI